MTSMNEHVEMRLRCKLHECSPYLHFILINFISSQIKILEL